ncbi:magnesium transporter CorA family protein [Longitalea luteola]|uniref:magnesium transporter CorA family protein n=1 Tax=Longitalea luteola TaxID=2812563 RepID=UPI001A9665BA|nr:CorA family divalent cation transporter [Longitalea luteola]
MTKKEQQIDGNIKWIDVTSPSVEEMAALSADYNLNPHIVRDCMQPEHLPKYEFIDDVNFLILRYYDHTASKHNATIQDITNKIAIFYTNDFILTIHKSDVPFLEKVRAKYVVTGKCSTVIDVLIHIAWNALESYDEPLNRLSEQVDFYEDQIMMKTSGRSHIEALYIIKRQASISHKILMLMQEPINHIYPRHGEEAAKQDLKDQHLKMQTLYTQVLEDVNNLLNLAMSFSAQRTSDVMKVLTIFSVFFMPLTFIVGIYGMNFEYMPELSAKWGYPGVLIIMGIVTGIIWFWFKRKKWL